MSNFWKTNVQMPIAQKSVSVPSENGLSYTENGKLVIRVDPSVEYFLPSESYLQFRLKLTLDGTAKTRLQLNDRIGGHSLINHIRILSGTGVLLEEIQNYNVLAYLMYSYDTNDTKRRKRTLTERTTMFNPACASTNGGQQRDNNSCVNNPYFANGSGGEFVYLKVCLPLVASGLFRNPKIFPTMLTQGLRLEITLEEAAKCVQRLSTVAPSFAGRDITQTATGLEHVPRLSSVNAGTADTGYSKGVINLTVADVTAAAATLIEFANDASIPFIDDGTVITFDSGFTGTDAVALNGGVFQLFSNPADKTFEIRTNAAVPVAVSTDGKTITKGTATGAFSGFAAVTQINLKQDNSITSVNTCPFIVGEKIVIASDDTNKVKDVFVLGAITAITAAGNDVSLTVATVTASSLTDDYTPSAAAPVYVFSRSFNETDFKPGYIVDEVELVMQQVIMPKGYTGSMMKSMKEKGMMRYDFLSFMNYKHSMVQSDTEATVQLPLQNSRAKAVLMLPLDSTSMTASERVTNDDSSAFKGILDGIKEYRFNVDQKLNPDRPVPLSLLKSGSIEQQYLIELEKALGQSSIQPTSFRNFSQAFCLGRAFALQGGSMDTRGKNVDVQISYDSPAVNKLWHMWTAHIKSIIVKQNDVSVQI